MSNSVLRERALLAGLQSHLTPNLSPSKKVELLSSFPRVQKCLLQPTVRAILQKIGKNDERKALFLSLLAIDQIQVASKLEKWEELIEIERFYESIGGIIGYHCKVLELILAKTETPNLRKYFSPPSFDIRLKSHALSVSTLAGIESMEKMGEIYPIGGLGDRLNLKSETGESLPTAMLSFCGRSLLEGLIRDLQGREFLYYKLFHKQIVTPIALMTSHEKNNESHISNFLENKEWFLRGKENFFLFSQISVPVVTSEGVWSMRSHDELNLHPGGHGAIWRMAEEKGVYDWFESRGLEFLIVRQINNPIAGCDHGLLALAGLGVLEEKAFGFASCKRALHAAEGVLTLRENERGEKNIVNIEYTDFKQYGIQEAQDSAGDSLFPTNTNILFANLKKLKSYIEKTPIPGLILNMKSEVPYIDSEGKISLMKGGRLESMMQNLSDVIDAEDVFLTYNERKKTISTTKRVFEEGKSALETPVGAFCDMMQNAKALLEECCDFSVEGDDVIFLYHPALGPLYEVIGQKIRGGKIKKASELQLEIAEISIRKLHLEGSLLITSENVIGTCREGRMHLSWHLGRCKLSNVTVKNSGIDRTAPNIYWKNEIARLEKLEIRLLGCSEFIAENITFNGDFNIVVPDGERWVAFENEEGKIDFHKQKIDGPTWSFVYEVMEKEILVRESTFHKHISQDKQSPQEQLLQPLTR